MRGWAVRFEREGNLALEEFDYCVTCTGMYSGHPRCPLARASLPPQLDPFPVGHLFEAWAFHASRVTRHEPHGHVDSCCLGPAQMDLLAHRRAHVPLAISSYGQGCTRH